MNKEKNLLESRWQLLNSKVNSSTKTNFVIAIIALVITVIISISIPRFMSIGNMLNIVEQISIIGFLAIGMTYVLIGGGIDLSMHVVVSASAVVGAKYMIQGGSPIIGCLIILLISLCFGFINAVAIAIFRMTPFIVTLSTMFLAQGFAIWFTKTSSVTGLPQSFIDSVGGSIFGKIPIPIVIIIIVTVVTGIILSSTKYGRWIYLTGNNEQAARVSGIPSVFTKFTTYLFSSLMAGITAIIILGIINAATTTMIGDVRLMDIISACVIGGASLKGGTGSILGTMLGVLFIIVVGNCMNLLNVEPYLAMTIKGIIIVIIIGLDVLRSRSSNMRS